MQGRFFLAIPIAFIEDAPEGVQGARVDHPLKPPAKPDMKSLLASEGAAKESRGRPQSPLETII